MTGQAEPAETAASISDALALLHIRFYGTGLSAVQTFLTDDYAFCVLTDPYTSVEQTLIKGSKRLDVRNRRRRFETLMTKQFESTIENITGRTVTGFMGQTHVAPDLAIEVFSFADGVATEREPTADDHAAAISNAVSLLHAHYYGKQPNEVRTFLTDGYAFCVLTNPFTTVEQTLIEVGEQTAVHDMRAAFEGAMSLRFRHAVGEITQREVLAFMSLIHVGPDLAVEVFKFKDFG